MQDFFTDPRLAGLIRTALANNRDLRVSVLNIEQARAQFQIERSNLFPALGLTGTGDDALIASIASNVSVKAERDTGRTFAVTSNTTYRYSTDGQSALIIHDRPYADASRVVSLSGVALVEGTNVWFLPDRRNNDATATIQIEPFNREGNWWFGHSNWFDANLDSPSYRTGTPNDCHRLVCSSAQRP